MNNVMRAAGLAAASLLAVVGTAYAAPAHSWDAVPATSFLDHASASLQGGDLGLNPLAEPAPLTAEPPPAVEPAAGHEAPAPVAEPPPAEPEQPVRRPLAELVADHMSVETAGAEHECLAGAVYFESKGESLQGQLSVAEVVLNRSRSGRFPASICGVVTQRCAILLHPRRPLPADRPLDRRLAQGGRDRPYRDQGPGRRPGAPRALLPRHPRLARLARPHPRRDDRQSRFLSDRPGGLGTRDWGLGI